MNINHAYGKFASDTRLPATMSDADKLALARVRLTAVVTACERLGVVVTVQQFPLLPLAMGNYETVVSVRLAREAIS